MVQVRTPAVVAYVYIIFVLLCVARSGWNISCQVARRGEQVLKLAVVAGAAILPRPLSVLGELRGRQNIDGSLHIKVENRKIEGSRY